MLRLKSKASCRCGPFNTTSCATNVTIAQPRAAPPKPNRTKAYMDKGSNDTQIEGTFVPNANSVQNNYFLSGGYGAPQSANRKQDTLGKNDKSPLSSVSGNWAQGSAYANGYMYRSQAKLEANVGSLDRLGRLKAQSVANSKNYPPLNDGN